MTTLVPSRISDVKIDRRWFGVFLALQAVILAGTLLVSNTILYLVLAGVGGGIFVVLLLIYPWVIVPVIVATTALDLTGRLVKTTAIGVPLTGFHLALALMVIALLTNICLRRRVEFPAFELKGPLFMLLGMMAVSLTYSPNQPEATIGFMRTVALVLFLYLTQVMIDSRRAVDTVVFSMALAIIGGSAMGAWQVATGEFHLPVRVVSALGANVPRATATFHNPNIFGAFLMGGVIPLLGILLNCRIKWWKVAVLGLAVIIGVLGIMATFSRSNWVSTAVGVLVVLWLGKKLRYFFVFAFAGLLAVLALKEFVPFAAFIFDRFISIFTFFEEFGSVARTSSTTRVYLIFASFNMFLDHPLLGVGWRGFPVVFSHYAPQGYPYWSLVDEAHTVLAAILAGQAGRCQRSWMDRILERVFWERYFQCRPGVLL